MERSSFASPTRLRALQRIFAGSNSFSIPGRRTVLSAFNVLHRRQIFVQPLTALLGGKVLRMCLTEPFMSFLSVGR